MKKLLIILLVLGLLGGAGFYFSNSSLFQGRMGAGGGAGVTAMTEISSESAVGGNDDEEVAYVDVEIEEVEGYSEELADELYEHIASFFSQGEYYYEASIDSYSKFGDYADTDDLENMELTYNILEEYYAAIIYAYSIIAADQAELIEMYGEVQTAQVSLMYYYYDHSCDSDSLDECYDSFLNDFSSMEEAKVEYEKYLDLYYADYIGDWDGEYDDKSGDESDSEDEYDGINDETWGGGYYYYDSSSNSVEDRLYCSDAIGEYEACIAADYKDSKEENEEYCTQVADYPDYIDDTNGDSEGYPACKEILEKWESTTDEYTSYITTDWESINDQYLELDELYVGIENFLYGGAGGAANNGSSDYLALVKTYAEEILGYKQEMYDSLFNAEFDNATRSLMVETFVSSKLDDIQEYYDLMSALQVTVEDLDTDVDLEELVSTISGTENYISTSASYLSEATTISDAIRSRTDTATTDEEDYADELEEIATEAETLITSMTTLNGEIGTAVNEAVAAMYEGHVTSISVYLDDSEDLLDTVESEYDDIDSVDDEETANDLITTFEGYYTSAETYYSEAATIYSGLGVITDTDFDTLNSTAAGYIEDIEVAVDSIKETVENAVTELEALIVSFDQEVSDDEDESEESDEEVVEDETDEATEDLEENVEESSDSDDSDDSDGDGLDNFFEIKKSLTDPEDEDTDDDGYTDYEEIENGTDPLVVDEPEDEDEDEKDLISGLKGTKTAIGEKSCSTTFTDITSHWAETAICAHYDQGLVKGKNTGTFDPDANITRAEFLKIIMLVAGLDPANETGLEVTKYSDVNLGDWYYDYVALADSYGYLWYADDEVWEPNVEITRGDAITLIMRIAEKALYDFTAEDSSFTDFDVDSYQAYAIILGEQYEIISGYDDGTFRPDDNMTRAEAVQITYKAEVLFE